MKYIVTKIKAKEGKPQYSAWDPYNLTRFGSINFEINGVRFKCDTYDRYTDDLYVNDGGYHLRGDIRMEVCEFLAKIWDKKVAEFDNLPMAIKAFVP